MATPAARNLAATFFERAQARGDEPFMWAKRDGAYRAWSWRQTAEAVSALSRGLRDLGIEAGDRVVLVSENRPEWVIADLAIMAAAAITVPAYITNTRDDHTHILGHSGARAAIVSNAALAGPLLAAAKATPDIAAIIAMEAIATETNKGGTAGPVKIHSWDDVIGKGAALADDVAETVAGVAADDLACFIYTSGTGGRPKGVMLSHGAIACNVVSATDLLSEVGLGGPGEDVFLSFLPLSHSY